MRLEIKRGFSSPPVAIGLLLALAAAPSACANPECPAGEKRIGTRCEEVVRLPDGAVVPAAEQPPADGGGDEAAPERTGDASTAWDATTDLTSGGDGGLIDVAPELDAARKPDEQADGDAAIVPAPSDLTSGDVPDAAMNEPMPAEPPPEPTTPPPEQPSVPPSCVAAGACMASAETSCMTACGTSGTGMCSATCEPPTVAACTPPAEACNGIDDDCDGGNDEGLLTSIAGATRRWPGIGPEDQPTNIILVARPEGGAWLSARPWMAGANPAPSFQQLDAQGTPVGAAVSAAQSAGFERYMTSSDSKWLVMFGKRVGTTAAAGSLEIQLYRLSDMSFVSQTSVFTGTGVQCKDFSTAALEVAEDDQGSVHIAYGMWEGSGALDPSGYCALKGSSYMRTVAYSAQGQWSSPVTMVATEQYRAPIMITRAACAAEWLTLMLGPTRIMRRHSLSGAPIQAYTAGLPDDGGIGAVVELTPTCGSTRTLGIGINLSGTSGSILRLWKLDDGTGVISSSTDVIISSSQVGPLRWARSGGRAYATFVDLGSTNRLMEIDVEGATARDVPLGAPALGDDSGLILAQAFQPTLRSSDVVPTAGGLLVAAARDSPTNNLGAGNVAETYRIACP